ncbi:O-antigen ligase family protein [uncultured Flavobacterium sp.]|uniref:O-antigen ligase family protein n=1 Tax=uncultured Flavobacterium sp. TaxID=165435 RepID=UPI0025EED8D0|nr:O-antigen ligase family protein [uncultured Flavobacterium sp.]
MIETVDNIMNETKGKNTFPSAIILCFIVSLLAIDFFPYFKSLEIINPQFFYLSLVNALTAIYLYTNSSLISKDIISIFKKSYVLKLYSGFVLFCALSYFGAKNTSLVFTKITEIAIVFCLFVNLSILLKDKLNLIYKIAFIVSISAFFQAWQQLAQFVITPKNAAIIDLLDGMKGNTGNINILAASLTIKIPFILTAMLYYRNYKRLFLLIALFSVASVIFLTGARTPLINIFLLCLIYTAYILREYTFKKAAFIRISYLILPLLLAIIFSNSIFDKTRDNERYVSLENRVERINAEDASSKARLSYWKNALQMSHKHPFLGIGLGNYQIESIPYERTISNDLVVSLHAHNDFLEILAETGIINGLIYFSLFVCLLIVSVKNAIKSSNKESELRSILILMLLIVYGIDSLFNFPMYRPTMAIFFSLLLALSLLNNAKTLEARSINNSVIKIMIAVLIATSLITSFSAYEIYKASHLEYLIFLDDINMKDKGELNGDEVIKRMPAYPNVFNTSESFYEYAGIYYIREKQYDKALKCLSEANKINGYTGRVLFYKAVISRNKKDLDSAYFYSKQAFYLRPRNSDFYKASFNFAALRKDTLEMIKEHKLFNEYRPASQTWIDAAKVLRASGYNYKNLLVFVNQGLKVFPKDSILTAMKNNLLITDYLIGGQNLEMQSDLNKALSSYEQILKIDSQNVYALQNIGFNYLKQGKTKNAISSLLKASQHPGLTDGKTEFFLGICYFKENDKANGLKYLNLSKDKGYPAAEQIITEIQNIKGVDQKALTKRKNDHLIAEYIAEGQKNEEQNKMKEALLSYQKAEKIDPKNIYAAQNIGFYYLKTGQSKKAINYLLNALKSPGLNDGKTEYFLAICYIQQNDAANACKYLDASKSKNYSEAGQMIKKFCR